MFAIVTMSLMWAKQFTRWAIAHPANLLFTSLDAGLQVHVKRSKFDFEMNREGYIIFDVNIAHAKIECFKLLQNCRHKEPFTT